MRFCISLFPLLFPLPNIVMLQYQRSPKSVQVQRNIHIGQWYHKDTIVLPQRMCITAPSLIEYLIYSSIWLSFNSCTLQWMYALILLYRAIVSPLSLHWTLTGVNLSQKSFAMGCGKSTGIKAKQCVNAEFLNFTISFSFVTAFYMTLLAVAGILHLSIWIKSDLREREKWKAL